MGSEAETVEKAEMKVEDQSRIRIFIGGLGESVTREDVEKVLTQKSLGKVEDIEFVRTKGRSFAYVDFSPSDDHSLSKLFSMYNGCLWKGGRLKLERAKEHYLVRLRREWAEEAQQAAIDHAGSGESNRSLEAPKKNPKQQQLRIYFPRLRKVKTLPFTGTGKHKYSFQRLSVPPLPVNFCDRKENSGHSDRSQHIHGPAENETGGMNEDEIKLMTSVMSRLFQKENDSEMENEVVKAVGSSNNFVNDVSTNENEDCSDDNDDLVINMVSKKDSRQTMSVCKEQKENPENKLRSQFNKNCSKNSVNNVRTDETEDFSGDKDDLVINVVSKKDSRQTMFVCKEQPKANPENKMRSDMIQTSKDDGLKQKPQRAKRASISTDKEPKLLQSEESKEVVSNIKIDENAMLAKSSALNREPYSGTKTIVEESGRQQSAADNCRSRKSSWKKLIGDTSTTTFSISHLLQDIGSSGIGQSQTNSASTDRKNEEEKELLGNSMKKQSRKRKKLDRVEEFESAKSDVASDKEEEKEMSGSSAEKQSYKRNKSDRLGECESANSDVAFNKQGEKEMCETSVENQSCKRNESDQPAEYNSSDAASNKGRGVFWRHKSSWTQLVNENNGGLFSLSQVLPECRSLNVTDSAVTKDSQSTEQVSRGLDENSSATLPGGFGSVSGSLDRKNNPVALDLQNAPEEMQFSLEEKKSSPSQAEEKCSVEDKKSSGSLARKRRGSPLSKKTIRGDGSGEACPFMRSAASLKEWSNVKTALNGALKKKKTEKTSD